MTSVAKSGSATRTEAETVRQIVTLGCRAPSVHNTQPWRWRIAGNRVELRVDRSRQLQVSDPDGRTLMMSCGAGLHHVQVAAAGLGWTPSVARFPDAEDPQLLAVVDLHPDGPPTPADVELLEAVERRQTDRRRFTSWPVPEERMESLASVAQRWGARVLPLTGAAARATVERLVDRALEYQSRDTRYLGEQCAWIDRSAVDGVPSAALPPQEHSGERRDRFQRDVRGRQPTKPIEGSDRVLAICTAADDPPAWLDAGETLSALWLRAVQAGISLVPLSQVVEVEETRRALSEELFDGMARPQLLVRVGWQEVTRACLPMTPRRPLQDVLDP